MTNIRLVASDIDGTLTNEQRELTPYTRQILQVLLQRDIPVVLVSGRNPWATQHYLQEIGEGARAICQNGIFLLEDGEIHGENFIAPELARAAVKLLLEHDSVPLVYGEDRITRYLPTATGMTEVAKLLSKRTQQPYVKVTSVEGLFFGAPGTGLGVRDTRACGGTLPALRARAGRSSVHHLPTRHALLGGGQSPASAQG